ncbi:putative ribonuclease H-like domain-containing protein [Tanacetum coccineum]
MHIRWCCTSNGHLKIQARVTSFKDQDEISEDIFSFGSALEDFICVVFVPDRNIVKDMDLETAQTTTTTKLPILKQGEYDMWRLRIEQYFQVQDYALWDVIENENSFKPVAQTIINADGTSTSLIPGHVTTEEKVQNKNDVKARSMLLMALPNEHLTTFNQYKDAKTLFVVTQTRFGGNEATKKTQKTLLKQMYKNFSASSTNSLDSIFNRLPKIITTDVQPNGSQLVYEDLEQIHEDDIKEMDLKWQLVLLSMRTRRGPRNQGSRNRNQDSSRRTVNMEETSSKAMVTINGAGFDWSYMVDDEVPTNIALIAFSDSEFNKFEFNLATYKRGLASVEEQLVVLKRDISYKDSEISMLKIKKGVGFVSYNVVPPPPTWLFSPPKFDLSNSGLKEFQQPEFEGYGPKTSKSVSKDICNEVRESLDAPLVKELVSDDKLEKKTANCNYFKEWVVSGNNSYKGHPQKEDQGYVDSGCSRHMTGNMSYLSDFNKFDGGYMCDKKNSVLFTDTGCFVLSPDFKLADESQVLLKVPRKNNMYSVDMKNIVPKECLTCLVAKATLDESMLWHRRLGHVNFKTINKLVKENLVRGLPSKRFENDQTCVACLKGKQHKASCKSKIQNSITQPLFMLHMDLFGPTFVSSLMNKKYCLVVTDDYSRFTWVFFLASKDETSGILKSFITEIENLVDKKVKIIRCDNGTEFKNRVMSEFCEKKGIKKEFSNRVLVVKPHNKTPYELFRGRTPALSFMRPFKYHGTILNTFNYLGKFDGKSDEGFFVRYLMNSKAFRIYNIKIRKVEENWHIMFLEDKPIIVGKEESISTGHSRKEIGSSQDYILMPIDAEKKDDEGINKESGIDDRGRPEKSTKDVNTARPSINTASTNVNIAIFVNLMAKEKYLP